MSKSNNLEKKQPPPSICPYLMRFVNLVGVLSVIAIGIKGYPDYQRTSLSVSAIYILFIKDLKTTTISRICIIWGMRLKMALHPTEERFGLDLIPWSFLSSAGEGMLRWPRYRWAARRKQPPGKAAHTLAHSPLSETPERWTLPKLIPGLLFLRG